METERQLCGVWLASTRTDHGRLVLCEGLSKLEAERGLRHLLYEMSVYPAMAVQEEFLGADEFSSLFNRRRAK